MLIRLTSIINERRGQANFQLVVIVSRGSTAPRNVGLKRTIQTHDEDFLSELGRSDALDKYWYVL